MLKIWADPRQPHSGDVLRQTLWTSVSRVEELNESHWKVPRVPGIWESQLSHASLPPALCFCPFIAKNHLQPNSEVGPNQDLKPHPVRELSPGAWLFQPNLNFDPSQAQQMPIVMISVIPWERHGKPNYNSNNSMLNSIIQWYSKCQI